MNKLVLIFILLVGFLKAQNSPVTSSVQTTDLNQIKICFKVDENWMVYDAVDGEDGPIPLQIEFSNKINLETPTVQKPKLKSKFDDVFEVNIQYFDTDVCYQLQTQKINPQQEASITIDYQYMMCNLKTGICLPPTSFKEIIIIN